jgi:hypothetical protein
LSHSHCWPPAVRIFSVLTASLTNPRRIDRSPVVPSQTEQRAVGSFSFLTYDTDRLLAARHSLLIASGKVGMLSDMTDQSLLAYYESVRRQVAADCRLRGKHRLSGERVKQYADRLKKEIDRRQLSCMPIDWPPL